MRLRLLEIETVYGNLAWWEPNVQPTMSVNISNHRQLPSLYVKIDIHLSSKSVTLLTGE